MGKHFRWSIILVSLFLLFGCASPHVLTLRDGTQIETKDEPQFNEKTGFYTYKGKDGKKAQVNKDEVATISTK
jgi:major membrane immunogen (membrane-anchored lipoprotein)